MFKKLALSFIIIYSTITISSTKYDKFLYKYKVVAHDNSALGLINLYNAKQHLITIYSEKILYKDPSLHQHLIIENLQEFAYENSVARYEEGMIVIIIGEGKGSIINGELRKNFCDENVTNNRIYIIEWLKGLWD
ncbi:TPA: hypothetical protein GXZ54_01520 [bacterium]|nr:hypothetical protein [bacterium]